MPHFQLRGTEDHTETSFVQCAEIVFSTYWDKEVMDFSLYADTSQRNCNLFLLVFSLQSKRETYLMTASKPYFIYNYNETIGRQ